MPDRGALDYKRGDINIRTVIFFAFGLAAMTVLAFALMWVLFGAFESREAARDRETIPTTRLGEAKAKLPPEPILQGAPGSRFERADPVLEMEAFLEEQIEELTSFGWIDREAGVARIPIEEAKNLLLQRGLPARKAGSGEED